jgi:tetratricopeptide (TPR) repeat protein
MTTTRQLTFMVLLLALIGLVSTPPAVADRAVQRISERSYQQLTQIHRLMDRQRYDAALTRLDSMRSRVAGKPAELALVLQSFGHIYSAQQKYPQAIAALNECLALDALPKASTARTLYVLAQLQLVESDHAGAVTSMERWLGLEEKPQPAGRALAGIAYAQAQRYPEAIEQLTLAIDQADPAREDWFRQLLAVYYQSGQYSQAADLLQGMILLFPQRKDYWLQLSGVYAERGEYTQSLAVLELAYLQGLLSTEQELLNLAQHYLYTGLANKAAELLENSLTTGALTPNQANWNLLIDAWLHARETTRALAAVQRALAAGEHPELHLRHARLLADTEDWAAVLKAARRALASDGLSEPGTAHLLAGLARFHLQQPQQAQEHFRLALQFDHSRHQAGQWLDHLAAMSLYEKQFSAVHLSP